MKTKIDFLELATKIKRNGIVDLLKYLDTTDFFEAPASGDYHNNCERGLIDHSINVTNQMQKLNDDQGLEIDRESILIVGLFHDICKINTYKVGETWDKEHKEKTGEWKKKKTYITDEDLPIGHGDKSVAILAKYLDMTNAEMAAIRFHMGAFEVGVMLQYGLKKQFYEATSRYPITNLVHIADMIASRFIEQRYD